MKVYNNNQLYKSPAGDQLWNSGRQDWIFGRIGDQEGAISDPDCTYSIKTTILWMLGAEYFLKIAKIISQQEKPMWPNRKN